MDGTELGKALFARVAGNITKNEREYLDRWLEASSANREVYRRIMDGESVKKFLDNFDAIDRNEMMSGIGHKIAAAKRRRFFIVAASSAVAILVAVLFLFRPLPDDDRQIEPADRFYAVLSLPGGKIVLDDPVNGMSWKDAVEENVVQADTGEALVLKIEVPRGKEYRLELPDGTKIWLNSETVIEYPSYFGDGEREVAISGEAYFEVERDEAHPFVATTPNGVSIRVLGTSFNLTEYSSEPWTFATLVEGEVDVLAGGRTVRMTSGKQAVIGETINITEVDTRLYTAWTKGMFEFENMTLKEICARLSRWYDVEFKFEDGSGQERFTGGTWKRVPLEDFLERMESLSKVSFATEDDWITVRYKK